MGYRRSRRHADGLGKSVVGHINGKGIGGFVGQACGDGIGATACEARQDGKRFAGDKRLTRAFGPRHLQHLSADASRGAGREQTHHAFEQLQRTVERRLLAPVFHEAAGVRHGRAVAGEEAADLGQG